MGTRVIRIQECDTRDPQGVRRFVDPEGTALMVAISGTVLAATLMFGSMSTGGGGRGLAAAQGPEPAPPPTWTAPQPGGAPMSR